VLAQRLCTDGRHTGYRGRPTIAGFLVPDTDIADRILARAEARAVFSRPTVIVHSFSCNGRDRYSRCC